MSPGSFFHMKQTIRDRLKRESLIEDEDIDHVVQQIIDYPFLGGNKGSLKLRHDEKALISGTLYGEVKQQLRLEVEKDIQRRREQSELEKNRYKRSSEQDKEYEHIVPSQIHEIWSIDFLTFVLYGIYFNICVVYEIFSQAYLAIKVADRANSEVAIEAVKRAVEYSGSKPERYLLSDNGSVFISEDFEELLDSIKMNGQQIPPGQPWYNGALESGNRDLKKTLYTIAFHDACKDIKISGKGIARDHIESRLEVYCDAAQQVINEQIVRPKFKTTPIVVLNKKEKESLERHYAFIAKKKQQRKERKAVLKDVPVSKRKRVEDKVLTSWKKISSSLSINELFAFSELLNERYHAITI